MNPDARLAVEDDRMLMVAYCAHCRSLERFIPTKVANHRYLIFSLLTGGVWLIPWLTAVIGKAMRPLRCKVCGWHKPEFRRGIYIQVQVERPAESKLMYA